MKGVSAVSLEQGSVPLNHINVQRYVKGKTVWNGFANDLTSKIAQRYLGV